MANTTEETAVDTLAPDNSQTVFIPDFGIQSWEGNFIIFCCIAGIITNVPILFGIIMARKGLNQKLFVLLVNIELMNLLLILLYLPFLAAGLANQKQVYSGGWCRFLAGMSAAMRNYKNWLFIILTSWVRRRVNRHVRDKPEEKQLGKGKPLLRKLAVFGTGALLIYAVPAFVWSEAGSFSPVTAICRLNADKVPIDILQKVFTFASLIWGIAPYFVMFIMLFLAVWQATRSQFRVSPEMYFDSPTTSAAEPETANEPPAQTGTSYVADNGPQPVNVLIQPVINPSAPPEEAPTPPAPTEEDRKADLARMKADFLFCMLMCIGYWLSRLPVITIGFWHRYGPPMPYYAYRVPEYPMAIEYILNPILCFILVEPVRAMLVMRKSD